MFAASRGPWLAAGAGVGEGGDETSGVGDGGGEIVGEGGGEAVGEGGGEAVGEGGGSGEDFTDGGERARGDATGGDATGGEANDPSTHCGSGFMSKVQVSIFVTSNFGSSSFFAVPLSPSKSPNTRPVAKRITSDAAMASHRQRGRRVFGLTGSTLTVGATSTLFARYVSALPERMPSRIALGFSSVTWTSFASSALPALMIFFAFSILEVMAATAVADGGRRGHCQDGAPAAGRCLPKYAEIYLGNKPKPPQLFMCALI